MSWSFDSLFLATKNDNIPNVIWIWQVSNLSLYSIAVHLKPVKTFSWSPKANLISVICENNKVYVLTLSDASVCPIISEGSLMLQLSRFCWSGDGKMFMVGDRTSMFTGCPIEDGDEK